MADFEPQLNTLFAHWLFQCAITTMFHNEFSPALSAARATIVFCHGFDSMELAGASRPGGKIDRAIAGGIEATLASTEARVQICAYGLRLENDTA